jgi:hypothetical protein
MRLSNSILYILVKEFNQNYHIVHSIKEAFESIF